MARKIFQDSIDFTTVRVHNRAYMPCAGSNAMTPNGQMYFPKKYYKPDYSSLENTFRIWFIHEMAHVWQYQLGYNVKWAGIRIQIKGGYRADQGQSLSRAYRYDASSGSERLMCDFNMEQQGELLSHYFDAVFLTDDSQAHRMHVQRLPFLRKILADFIDNPSNLALLPNASRIEA